MRATAGTIRGLALATHAGPTATVTLVMTVLALGVGHDVRGALGIGLMVLLGQVSVGWSNDAIDAARDLANQRRTKPVVRGLVDRETLWTAAVLALLLAVIASLAIAGPHGGAAHIVAVLSAWAYNAGLKATVVSFLPYALSFGLLPSVLTWALPEGGPAAGWASAVFALLGVGAHLANGVPDVEHDVRAGHRGIVPRIGAHASVTLAALLMLLGTALLARGLGWSTAAVVGAVVAASLIVVTAALVRGGRHLFVAFLGLACVIAVVAVANAERIVGS